MKRLLSASVLLALLLSLMPAAAAQTTVIRTAQELSAIREDLSGDYVLGADIDLAAFGPWTPIGTKDTPFTGSLDGGGYTITNLTVTVSEEASVTQYVGLFGYGQGARFSGLALENLCVTSTHNVPTHAGGLIGFLQDGVMENCSASGAVQITLSSYGSYIGGLAGSLKDTAATDCMNTADITASGTTNSCYAGGIAGYCTYTNLFPRSVAVSGCENYGQISSTTHAGGIAGYLHTPKTCSLELRSCSNRGTVTGNYYAGGIVGYHYSVAIRDCENHGDLRSGSYKTAHYVGGIAGYTEYAAVSGCSNTGDALVERLAGPYTGGIVGYLTSGSVELCSSTGDMTAISIPGYNAFSGGIAAAVTNSSIRRCYNTGNVTAHTEFKTTGSIGGYTARADGGGIAGTLTGSSSVMENCYNTGSIQCSSAFKGYGGYYNSYSHLYAGGIAGRGLAPIRCCYSTGEVKTVNNNNSSYTTCYPGAVCGITLEDDLLTDCYYSSLITADAVSGNTSEPDAYSLSLSRMRNPASFEGFDFSSVWVMAEGYPYPSLQNNPHEGPIGPTVSAIRVPAGKYVIHAVDEHGFPLSGASVVWQDPDAAAPQTATTDEEGNAYLTDTGFARPSISVTLENKLPWDNSNAAWEKNSRKYETVILYPLSYGGLQLESAVYQCGLMKTDLLTETKRVALPCRIAGTVLDTAFEVRCEAADPAQTVNYELRQKGTLLAQSTDGVFSGLNASDFAAGKGLFIRVSDSKGRTVDTPINLEFTETNINERTSMSMMNDKISFALGDDIPFLGGTTVEVDFPNVPINFQIDDEKIYLGVNLDLNPEEGETVTAKAEELSKALDGLAYVTGLGKGRLYDPAMREYMLSELKECSMPGGKFDISVVGYGEGDLGSTVLQAEIYLIIKGTAPLCSSTTIVPVGPVPVPVTFQVEAEAEGRGGLRARYDWSADRFDSGLDLRLTVGLDVFGGLGVGDLLGAGAYGSAEVDGKAELIGSNPGVEYIDLTGQLGVRAYLGPLSAEKAFVYQTWHLYTRNSARTMAAGPMEPLIEAADYQIEQLDYLQTESRWLGGSVSLMSGDLTVTALTPLLEGTYRNAQPVMIGTEDALYAAFIRGDADTGDTYVAVTKFDGTGWSEPVTAAAGGCSEPSIAMGADGLLQVACVYTAPGFDGQTLMSYAENRSVMTVAVDPSSMEVVGTHVFTEPNCYDPKLLTAEGETYLLCRNSPAASDEAVLQPEDAVILCAALSDDTPALQPLWDTGAMILTYAPGMADGAPAAGCIVDGDGDPATADDRSIYVLQQGTGTRLAETAGCGIAYGTLPGESGAGFLWIGENTLCSESSTVSAPGITEEFAVVGQRIYYSTATGGSANLTVLQYRDGSWGLPVQHTDQACYLEDLSVASCGGSDYILGMQTLPTIGESTVVTEKNLVWATVGSVTDLVLDGILFDPNRTEDGKTPITLSVVNAGDRAAGLQVLADGTLLHTEETALQPGETAELTVWVNTPAALTELTMEVKAAEGTDRTPENNTASVLLGQGDLEVELAHQQVGLQRSLLAVVYNRGTGPASGTVNVTLEDGSSLGTLEISGLAPGETSVTVLALDPALLEQDRDVTAAAVSAEEEFYTGNNTDTIYLTKTEYINTVASVALSEDAVTVLASSEGAAELYCAVYDANGQMVELHREALEKGVREVSFPVTAEDGTSAAAFLLGENAQPLAPAKRSK